MKIEEGDYILEKCWSSEGVVDSHVKIVTKTSKSRVYFKEMKRKWNSSNKSYEYTGEPEEYERYISSKSVVTVFSTLENAITAAVECEKLYSEWREAGREMRDLSRSILKVFGKKEGNNG